ncbi:MAG: septal ring lytic transglycosylase RlpA family protein [Cyanobacteria bacterium Co-bin8]|nr:septal ring lytic transglycosylase RlpA family protein [Cyanobacteria bacterium Co-bin8]
MSPEKSPDSAANAAVHPEDSASGSNELATSELVSDPFLDESARPEQNGLAEIESQPLSLADLARDDSLIVVQPHPFDSRQAATLYVRNLPVLTFLGNDLPALTDNKALESSSGNSLSDPVSRATHIGSQLEQFYAEGDAEQIAVRWNAAETQYQVTLNGDTLVAIDDNTILPDTTEDPAEDALQIANRLRRLLGDASSLEEIEGRPAPAPAQETLVVTSVLTGVASWYGPGFHGRRSASGEVFNQNAMTAAHRTLPFGTEVRVTNLNNSQQVIVRINDRGPFGHGRVLDLSAAAAQAIGLVSSGVGTVKIEVLGRP